MGVDVIESRNRTARKPHRCDYCGEIIEKGEEYSYQKNIFDGTFYEWHTHLACSRVASAIWDYCDPDDGMSDQDFCDGCQEVCQRFICHDCPKWNKEYGDCDDDLTYCIDRMDEFFNTHELYKAGRKSYYEIWKCREKGRVKNDTTRNDRIQNAIRHIKTAVDVDDWAKEIAVDAMGKKIPKKVRIEHHPKYGRATFCPNCNRMDVECWSYCPDCGQAIDWSE